MQLVLRKWSELIPGAEFRCFVKENKVIGMKILHFLTWYVNKWMYCIVCVMPWKYNISNNFYILRSSLFLAISQRDYTQHYQHIAKQEASISSSILEFFGDHIQYQFPDEDCKCISVERQKIFVLFSSYICALTMFFLSFFSCPGCLQRQLSKFL